MKYSALVLLLLLLSCQTTPELEEGRWTGALTPMNHPEMKNPVGYEISYQSGTLSIELIGPNGTVIKTQQPKAEADTLFFTFKEPEEQTLLDCALAKNTTGFAGRCTDPSGKWAHFTMVSPD